MFTIKTLNKQLEKQGAKWRAAETSLSKITTEQFKKMLGWKNDLDKSKPAPDWSKKQYKWLPGGKFDQVVDWRNRNGKNYVSPVPEKGQGGCGSCVAFAVTALVESMALIEKGILLDLSESDLAFCGSHASDCGAWGQGGALEDLKSRGVVTDNKFPYQDAFPNDNIWTSPPSCRVIGNHNNYSVKITAYENIFNINDRKSYLSNVGPLVAGISVYDDFNVYPGQIYSPAITAQKRGGHCILIIGYSDTEKYWLCKNSWGTGWGENGFVKIAYGACDIDIAGTYFTNCEGIIIPESVEEELVVNKGLAQLSNIAGTINCDGFFSGDDNMRHAITGGSDGTITEIFFNPKTGKGQSVLLRHPGLVDLGSFYTPDDKFRHVITADANGNINEIFYSPGTGIGNAPLGNIARAIRTGGFFSSDDNFRHAIVATTEGKIFEIFYSQKGKGQSQIGAFNNIIDIGCFYSDDDHFRHVIVATADGNIAEIFFSPQKGIHSTVLANIPGAKRVSGFYTSGNDFYNRRVQILTQDNNLYEIRYHPVNGMVQNKLSHIEAVVDIGGFYSADDKFAHCILTLKSGDIKELFY